MASNYLDLVQFLTRSDIAERQSHQLRIVGETMNDGLGESRTCMYFPTGVGPSQMQITTLVDVFDAMRQVGGGLYCLLDTQPDRTVSYRGYAHCRYCGNRTNGTKEHIYLGDLIIPEGARHYYEEHQLPLNLFSHALNGERRLWYVAKTPFTLLDLTYDKLIEHIQNNVMATEG